MSKAKAEKEKDEFELQSIAMDSSNDDIESPSNERIGLLPHQMPSSSGTDDCSNHQSQSPLACLYACIASGSNQRSRS